MYYVKISIFALCLLMMSCSEDADRSSNTDQFDLSTPLDNTGAMTAAGSDVSPDQGTGSMMNPMIDVGGDDLEPMMDAGGNDQEPMMEDPPLLGLWELVWQDEFEGTEINSNFWSHEVNCWGGGNNQGNRINLTKKTIPLSGSYDPNLPEVFWL